MQEHFLRNIKIINYKCFKNFEAKDFKRINLISGKNNVGKTAFIESLLINLYSISPTKMAYAIGVFNLIRDQLEFINEEKNNTILDEFKLKIENATFEAKSNINYSLFTVINEKGKKELQFIINDEKIRININEFSFEITNIENIKYLDKFGIDNDGIKELFEVIQKKDKEIYLNNLINKFDSTIENFKIIGNEPQCKISESSEYRKINEFGDGLKHYISIICAIFTCENGQLFIDEIDNGIHYSQLEKLWEIIFTISKEVNCQVFATTHSKEMINTYAKISQKLEDEDISFIELGKNKDNEVKVNVYDKEMFLYELNQNHEVRGW
ncbi:AAA family ATPase [Aliarcobacter butzleri]|uniref:AAA family ATPase n=1 Tax=Aliarcobacter butzleri TaxID=28197 RepID=UPI001EDAD83D|nr:AAA family ATPase [Aliarcobacter butzleri]MCG3664629.1 AAA family ATPase [Aliarcobacter butzleri]